MACNNCSNGCINPQMCACDCTTCAEANSCDIPVGDTGPIGPAGAQGLPGTNGVDGINGIDGTDGCTLLDVYISDGTDGNTSGDVIVTTGPTPIPCSQVINAGNLISAIISSGGATIPPGIIVMWSGAIVNIPVGWQLADGTNLQPDLRGRFIASYLAGDPNFGAPMAPGGSLITTLNQSNIPAHTHALGSYNATLSPLSGAHAHVWRGFWRDDQLPDQSNVRSQFRVAGDPLDWCTARPGDGTGDCTGDADPNCGAHTHAVTMSGISGDGQPALTAPQGAPFPLLPLFYTLAYIIKL